VYRTSMHSRLDGGGKHGIFRIQSWFLQRTKSSQSTPTNTILRACYRKPVYAAAGRATTDDAGRGAGFNEWLWRRLRPHSSLI
jgi:hypothetical protein